VSLYRRGGKRLLDVALAAAGMLVAIPVLAVAAVAIKLDSPGPVFHRAARVGKGGRRFTFLKLRSMRADAEELRGLLLHRNITKGPTFKLHDDPRVTRVGRFLRKTSLDELPQLFNVLRGDMSLVGPRPLPVRDYAGFNEDWHRRRFSVRPGMTCLWQVHGRSDSSFERWMALDMEYIDSWSLTLDVQILASTVSAVIRQTGAM